MANTKNITYDQLSLSLTKIKTYVDGKDSALNNAISSKANASHTHKTSDITSLDGYTKASAAAALSTSDSLNVALGKLEALIDTKQGTHSHPYAPAAHTSDTTVHITADERSAWNAKSNLALGTTSATAFRGDYGQTAYNHATSAHNYAGSSSSGGAATSANKVNKSLTVKLNGGSTEGTDMFTFNGSSAKSINITASSVGASASGHNHNDTYYTESEINTKIDAINSSISTGDSTTLASAKSYTDTAIGNLIDGAPDALNTLNELAAALGDNENYASTITNALADKVDKVSGKGLSTNDFTAAYKSKLDGIASGAEVNQNAFANVKVGDTTVAADAKQDTLTLVAGSNVTITPDATNDSITIAAKDTVYSHPSHTAYNSGLYKVTVNGLGHVTAATAVAKSDITALGIPGQDTTYSAASTSASGLMTAAMVTKLNGIADGANKYSHPTSAGNKHIPSGGSSGQFLKYSSAGTAAWATISPADIGAATTSDAAKCTDDEVSALLTSIFG